MGEIIRFPQRQKQQRPICPCLTFAATTLRALGVLEPARIHSALRALGVTETDLGGRDWAAFKEKMNGESF